MIAAAGAEQRQVALARVACSSGLPCMIDWAMRAADAKHVAY